MSNESLVDFFSKPVTLLELLQVKCHPSTFLVKVDWLVPLLTLFLFWIRDFYLCHPRIFWSLSNKIIFGIFSVKRKIRRFCTVIDEPREKAYHQNWHRALLYLWQRHCFQYLENWNAFFRKWPPTKVTWNLSGKNLLKKFTLLAYFIDTLCIDAKGKCFIQMCLVCFCRACLEEGYLECGLRVILRHNCRGCWGNYCFSGLRRPKGGWPLWLLRARSAQSVVKWSGYLHQVNKCPKLADCYFAPTPLLLCSFPPNNSQRRETEIIIHYLDVFYLEAGLCTFQTWTFDVCISCTNIRLRSRSASNKSELFTGYFVIYFISSFYFNGVGP